MNTKTNIFHILNTLLLVLVTGACYAQDKYDYNAFIVVNDPNDTYVNLRSTDNTKPESVMARLKNGSVGYCIQKYGNWMMFEYMQGDSLVSGFVHSSMAKPLTDFEKLKSVGDTKSMSFTGKNITVSLACKAFNKNHHKYGYYDTNHQIVKTIDGFKVWGTDGGIPRYEYEKIEVKYGSKTVTLPQEAILGVYDPNLTQSYVYYDRAKDTLYIMADNSDGAGGYSVVFIIENKKYKERVVAVPY